MSNFEFYGLVALVGYAVYRMVNNPPTFIPANGPPHTADQPEPATWMQSTPFMPSIWRADNGLDAIHP